MKSNYQERERPDGRWEATIDGKTWSRLLPMSFTGPNAQKCFDGQKTQTRRLLDPQPDIRFRGDGSPFTMGWEAEEQQHWRKDIAPRYRVGEFFYIREPWRTLDCHDAIKPTLLSCHAPIHYEGTGKQHDFGKLRPAMFLQRRFARPARYEVTAVRPERVNEISEADTIAEGLTPEKPHALPHAARCDYLLAWNRLWDSIYDAPGTRFADAPWVFAYTFKRITP